MEHAFAASALGAATLSAELLPGQTPTPTSAQVDFQPLFQEVFVIVFAVGVKGGVVDVADGGDAEVFAGEEFADHAAAGSDEAHAHGFAGFANGWGSPCAAR